MFFLLGGVYSSWVARIPALRERLQLGDRDLGLILLAPAVGALLGFQFAGRLTARYGSRRMTRVSAGAVCALVVPIAFAPTPLGVAVSLALLGVASGLMDVAINANGVEVERELGRPILGSLHGLYSLGGLVGAGAGALAASQGLLPPAHLLTAAVVFGALSLVLGPGLLRHAPTANIGAPVVEKADASGAADTTNDSAPPATPALVRPTGLLLALGAVSFCSSVGEGAMADWSAVYLRDMLHTGEGLAALGYAAYSFAMLAGRFSADRLTLRLGSVNIVRYGGWLVAIGLGAGLLVNTAWAMMVGVLFVGMGLSVVIPTTFRAGGKVPGISPGAGIATLATISYMGFLAGPPAIGFLAEHFTLRGGLLFVVALALVLSALAPAVSGRVLRVPSLTRAAAWLTSRGARSPASLRSARARRTPRI